MASNARQRLESLLDWEGDLKPWVGGKHIPTHYKRITIDEKERARLAM